MGQLLLLSAPGAVPHVSRERLAEALRCEYLRLHPLCRLRVDMNLFAMLDSLDGFDNQTSEIVKFFRFTDVDYYFDVKG